LRQGHWLTRHSGGRVEGIVLARFGSGAQFLATGWYGFHRHIEQRFGIGLNARAE
jgi:hypothetical protein